MFGFNPTQVRYQSCFAKSSKVIQVLQNNLTNVGGRWIRFGLSEGPRKVENLLKISTDNVRMMARNISNDLLTRVSVAFPALEQHLGYSAISHDTYFENNHGFKEADLRLITPKTAIYSSPMVSFLHLNVPSPFLTQVRTFKSPRADPKGQPFLRMKIQGTESQPADATASLSTADLQAEKLYKTLLEQFSTGKKGEFDIANLSKEERERFEIALKGVATGYALRGSNESPTKKPEDKMKKLSTLAWWSVTFAVLAIIAYVLSRRMNTRNFEILPEEIDVRFEDVKGCDEAKDELLEIVQFLMNPDVFTSLGGKLPKGVLLSGPPGVGKTLLAKAVAGEAGVPFFHAAGSEFDETFVGTGARRVRDLFTAAKARAPCVIFIDEIDSVAGKRTTSSLHPYANQTINQLLSEMDGFKANEGIIILGATNQPERLDKAAVRPGRFDTKVEVNLPDIKGRTDIISLYMSKIIHSPDVDIDFWAKKTQGFSGAELQNMVNIAAIRAAVMGKDKVGQAEFEFAYDKQTLGVDMKSRKRLVEDLKITAYHEAGHTLVALYTKEAHPVHKVTIIAKGGSGGHTAFVPQKESGFQTKTALIAQLDTAMGGRAAEELIFGKDKVTAGARGDMMGATQISEQMIKQFAMSDKLGLRHYSNEAIANGLIGDSTKAVIDEEINTFLNESYKRAMTILKTHRRELDLLAEALLKYETLDGEEVKAVIEGRPLKRLTKSSSNIVDTKLNKAKAPPLVGEPLVV